MSILMVFIGEITCGGCTDTKLTFCARVEELCKIILHSTFYVHLDLFLGDYQEEYISALKHDIDIELISTSGT